MKNRLTEIFGTRNVLCDGAMGTSLYARGVFINRCYDELNLSQPDLIRTVHEEYLQAGAEIIETKKLWLQCHTFRESLQPILPSTVIPPELG